MTDHTTELDGADHAPPPTAPPEPTRGERIAQRRAADLDADPETLTQDELAALLARLGKRRAMTLASVGKHRGKVAAAKDALAEAEDLHGRVNDQYREVLTTLYADS